MQYTSQIWTETRLSLSGRPVFDDDEFDIMIQPNVGLYQGNHKVKHFQNGRVYVTNKRIVYISANKNEPRPSIGLGYEMIKKIEYQPKFLKSNPKIIFHLKDISSSSSKKNVPELISTTWVCPICSFSNDLVVSQLEQIKLHDDSSITCRTCGVTSEASMIVGSVSKNNNKTENYIMDLVSFDHSQCPNCTFVNHPSMENCEICGFKLPILNTDTSEQNDGIKLELETNKLSKDDKKVVKLSLRSGRADDIYTTINNAFIDFRNTKLAFSIEETEPKQLHHVRSSAGIHGLTQTGTTYNKEASILFERSIQDIQQLMSKANELISVSQRYKKILAVGKPSKTETVEELHLIAESELFLRKLAGLELKYELGGSIQQSKFQKAINKLKVMRSSSLNASKYPDFYIEELARHVADFLTTNNVLDNNNGMIPLAEIFLLYNRCRQVDLITPEELFDVAQKFDTLNVGFKIKKLSLDTSTKPQTSEKVPSIYIVSRYGAEKLTSQKIVLYIFQNPGTSEIQIQKQFRSNVVILRFLLDHLVCSGELALDRTLEGSFFWQNKFLKDC